METFYNVYLFELRKKEELDHELLEFLEQHKIRKQLYIELSNLLEKKKIRVGL